MVEIALSLGIIAIALVAIIGVMPTGLQVQRNNREDTILTRDGQYFLEAIRSGSVGSSELTKYVLAITYSNSLGNVVVHTNSPTGQVRGNHLNTLTNSQAIIGLLSTPRYFTDAQGNVVTNYIRALVRSVTSTAEEQSNRWRSPEVNEFLPYGFVYLLSSEVVPLNILPPVLTNWTGGRALARAGPSIFQQLAPRAQPVDQLQRTAIDPAGTSFSAWPELRSCRPAP